MSKETHIETLKNMVVQANYNAKSAERFGDSKHSQQYWSSIAEALEYALTAIESLNEQVESLVVTIESQSRQIRALQTRSFGFEECD